MTPRRHKQHFLHWHRPHLHLHRHHEEKERESGSSESEDESSSSSDEEKDDDASGFSSLTWALIVMLALVTMAGIVLGVVLLKMPKSPPASSTGDTPTSPTGTDATPTAPGDTASPTASETGTTSPSTAVPAAGFLGSLAASYTVTPAAVPAFAMPSSAIPSPSAAVSYIDSSWTRNKGGSAETLSFVDDPLDAGGGPVLQVVYKKGSYSGGGVGGIGNWQFPVFGDKKNRAVLSYEVGFSKDFDFVKGGKLPGLFGGDAGSGCTGGRASTNCFSLRLMWRDKGAGEVYAYIPTYSGFCGTSAGPTTVFCHQDDFGASIDRGSFSFAAGSWTTVTQVAILNSAPDKANGVLELYVGEKAVIQLDNVIFRTNTSVFVNALTFSTFFGGSTTDYAATADCWTYYRNFQFFEGDAASSANGSTQAAKAGS
ncbi:hypothetical protein JCM10021v2_002085 [Rhodotorula toruloides]|uniref:Polysaccharide lyase 14 domain-containing protein n=2 Tax=Rhodotorula toruloides TaxID=5286 RepID=A0A2T0AAG1_RHOTO|nr:hypothetical protein AAT19DRAFT_13968 [Rhodotorula toruloides]